MTDENFTSYEMMLIIDPTLGDDRTRQVIEELKSQIKDLEGTITFEDFWGTRYLAYKINRQEKGFYVVLNFNLLPTKLLGLTNELRLNQNVIRFITLKTPKNYEVLTLEALEKEAEKYKRVKKEDAKEEKEERIERAPRTSRPKPVEVEKKEEVKEEAKVEVKETPVEVEKKEEVKEEVKEEEKEEPKKKEPKKKESKITDLDDVDAKLKSIIDDPDISL